MSVDETAYVPAATLAAQVRDLEISPVEIAEAALRRVEEVDGQIGAICTIDPDQVRADARKAEQEVLEGRPLGPLHGVPVTVKDLIFTKALRTTGGSLAYRDFVPDEDDVGVERLRQGGAIVLGKTNVPEFGFRIITNNKLFGTTRNPWRLDRTCGGSSGGCAAAVAAGMGPLSLGADGGGSIRLPSSFCGVYGLKPSFGRVPMYPSCRDTRYPGFSGWETLESIGPITRTVLDAALALDVLAGPDPRDRHSLPAAGYRFAERVAAAKAELGGLRVAWTVDWGGYARAEGVVRHAVEKAAGVFAAMGASVENADPGFDDPVAILGAMVVLDGDVRGMRELIAAHPDIDERVAAIFSNDSTLVDLSDATARRRDLYDRLRRFFELYDLLLTPTVPVPAFDVGLPAPREIDGEPVSDPRKVMCFTLPLNLTGNPAATVPCGWTDDSLPIGLQIVGRHLDDDLVLRASRAFEIAAPWADRTPEWDNRTGEEARRVETGVASSKDDALPQSLEGGPR